MSNMFSLPLELVLKIFHDLSEATYHDWIDAIREIQTPPPGPLSWIYVTHVCRLWREAALSSPNLWNNIVILSMPSSKAFLARSGTLSISLTCCVYHSWKSSMITLGRTQLLHDFATHLLDPPTRVDTLTLSMNVCSRFVAGVVTRLAPSTVYLIGASSNAEKLGALGKGCLNGVERLHLDTETIPTPIEQFLPTTLRHLSLPSKCVHNGLPKLICAHDVVRTLRSTPLLETLHAVITNDDLPPELDDNDCPASLPQLRSVTLGGPVQACLFTLQHIAARDDLRVRLRAPPTMPEPCHSH